MKHYLNQLIEDLHQITQNKKTTLWEEGDPDDEQELFDFSQVDKFENGDVTAISQITGIEQAQLPPVEKLSQEQQALLATELEDMLWYFHFKLDFPINYPKHLRYAFIRKFWSEEHVSVSSGTIHIEFCNYNEEKCPFPGYCSICSDEEWQMKDEQGDHLDRKIIEDFDYPFEDDDNEPYTIDINELNDSHGNKIDLNSIPVPGLCTICKNNIVTDWDENLLCLMNRTSQRNETSFACGAFEKI